MNRKRGIGGGGYTSTVSDGVGNPAGGTSNAAGVNLVAGGTGNLGLTGTSQGQLSLIFLDALIVGGILFYLWTHRAQGGG